MEEKTMSNIPANLKYSKSHEWVLEEDGVFTIGLTDYAQDALGDIVFINLPEEGDSVTAGEAFSDVESVKAVSDVFSPVTGTVTAVDVYKRQGFQTAEFLLKHGFVDAIVPRRDQQQVIAALLQLHGRGGSR